MEKRTLSEAITQSAGEPLDLAALPPDVAAVVRGMAPQPGIEFPPVTDNPDDWV